jgi:long-chain acyl-CoA synthetase
MKGYFRNEPATREALAGGWFHTGDIGHLDEQGRLMITDRLKDLIVTAGGKKVAPQPVENRLRESPWIAEAILIGDQRPYVVCLLVPDFPRLEAEARERGWPLGSRDELLSHPEVRELFQRAVDQANRHLAPFETVKRFALLDRELSQDQGEITPTLKVKRRVVSARFAGMIDPLYREPRVAAAS